MMRYVGVFVYGVFFNTMYLGHAQVTMVPKIVATTRIA